MQNRILHLTRCVIPYIRELQPLAGSTSGCILMQQLDFWFHRHPDGFWKFLEPSEHQKYKQGDSWTEELGLSASEFRTAFDRIGTRYKSKKDYVRADDKFSGKFYCSYLDRRDNLTYYFRNDTLLDSALDNIIANKQVVTENNKSTFTVTDKSGFTANKESQSTDKKEVNSQEIDKDDFDKTYNTLQIPQQLVIPHQLAKEEIEVVLKLLKQVPVSKHQVLLDELQGAISTNSIRKGKIPLFKSLVKAVKLGSFAPSLGLAITVSRRKEAERITDHIEYKSEYIVDSDMVAKGASFFTKGQIQIVEKWKI